MPGILALKVHVPDIVGTYLIATLRHTSLGADADRLGPRAHRAVVTRRPSAIESGSSRNEPLPLLTSLYASSVPENYKSIYFR